MLPWFICGIALFVELNFRGFLLGRLAVLESGLWRSGLAQRFSPLALITSALIFAFDPFMVNTFQHLHWIAVWDGLIWGVIWVAHEQSLHHHRCACGRSHRDVQRSEIRVVVEKTGLSQQGAA